MISVIIPCYNYGRLLADAIDSALRQGGPDLPVEVLVVDDGSTDETAEVASRYGDRIRYLYQPNAGLSAARNIGMRAASHDLVVFLDADDMLVNGAIASLHSAWRIQSFPPAVLAGRSVAVNASGEVLGGQKADSDKVTPIPARKLALRSRFSPAVLADRRLLLEMGGFDISLRASEDRDMWIRAAARHPVALLDHVTLLKRDHGANMSRAACQQTASIERVLAKAFANPDLHLSPGDRRLARAVCWYQSALMYADAGEHVKAACQMLRSMLQCPLGPFRDAGMLRFSRLRGLGGMVWSGIRKALRFGAVRD